MLFTRMSLIAAITHWMTEYFILVLNDLYLLIYKHIVIAKLWLRIYGDYVRLVVLSTAWSNSNALILIMKIVHAFFTIFSWAYSCVPYNVLVHK